MDVTTQKGQELLDYIDNLAELAGDGERAVAFTTAWRAIRARLPFIEREAAAATLSLDVERLVRLIENEGVVRWADDGHRARFIENVTFLLSGAAAATPSLPLDVRIDWPCAATREAPGWCVPHDSHWIAVEGTCKRMRLERVVSDALSASSEPSKGEPR